MVEGGEIGFEDVVDGVGTAVEEMLSGGEEMETETEGEGK